MTSDDELEKLRRAAFGRASSADERRSAVHQLAAIDAERTHREQEQHEAGAWRLDRADDEIAVSPPADTPAASPDASLAEVLDESPGMALDERKRHAAKRGLHPLWLVPIVLASAVVGGVAGELGSAPTASRPSGSASGAPESVRIGDLHAVDRLFERERTERDAYPQPEQAEALRTETTRYLGGDIDGAQAWAGRTTDKLICLLVLDGEVGAGSCATRDDFAGAGITVGVNGYTVTWDGLHTGITPPTAYFD